MAIKVSPKKKEIILSNDFNVLFAFSVVLFLVALSGYFLLDYLNRDTQERIEEVISEIKEVEAGAPGFKKREGEILKYESVINDFIRVQEHRALIDPLLDTLEKSTHSYVQIREARIDAAEKTVRINGVARSLEALEQQHHIFKNLSLAQEGREIEDPIEQVDLLSLREDDEEDRVFFEFMLVLNPELLKNRKISTD